MDPFFSKTVCDRCGNSLRNGRIMSMFNLDVLCMECKNKEMTRPDYAQARDREAEAVRSGDYNFPGIGYTS